MAGDEGKSSMSAARLHHFLRMGQESGCYQPGAKLPVLQQIANDKVPSIEQMVADSKGKEAVSLIVRFVQENAGTRPEPVAFALAVCARNKDHATKHSAYSAVQDNCQSPSDLFMFVHHAEALSSPTTGWGRAQRKAVSTWYNSRTPMKLAEAVTRFISRKKWTHRDLIRLAHVKPTNDGVALVLKYVTKGWEEVEKELSNEDVSTETKEVLAYLHAVEQLKHSRDDFLAARLIETHSLTFEHVPTHLFKSKEIWMALIPRVSMSTLLHYLPKLSHLGFLRPNSPMIPLVVEQLKGEVSTPHARLQPIEVFLALKKYDESGKAPSGRLAKHRPTPAIMEALHGVFVASFKNVVRTRKRYLVAVDVRNPMVHSKIPGCCLLSPSVASGLLVLGLLQAEIPGTVEVMAFSNKDLIPIELQSDMLLAEVTKRMRETPMGPVSCSKPITWAKTHQKQVDVFIVCTDNQTKSNEIEPAEALHQYRQAMNLPQTKLVVCAMAAKGFTVASEDDPNMLDIAGFDSYVPQIINHFARSSC